MIRSMLKVQIIKAVGGVYGKIELPVFTVGVPENSENGDYATNIALVLASQLKKNPLEIASVLKEKLENSRLPISPPTGGLTDGLADWKIEVAAPGFINFRLNDDYLIKTAEKQIKNKKNFGKTNIGNGKTVLVEYFQLNIAKRPHVGHLRSAVIGDAIKRMLILSGYNAVSDTHIGDWGTQFGIVIYAIKQVSSDVEKAIARDPLTQYAVLYNLYNAAADDHDVRAQLVKQGWAQKGKTDLDHVLEKGKEEFAKLEQGDRKNLLIWREVVEVSMRELHDIANKLGLVKFNEHKGESSYEKDMPKIVKMALKKGVAKKLKDGAVVVDLADQKLDEAVLLKSDGASTYLLRDLATIIYRKRRWKFYKNLYVVDVRQSHHFNQVFAVAKKLAVGGVDESVHVDFGFMSLPEGPFSSRKGNTIVLSKLIGEAALKARMIIKEKNPNLKNAGKVAEMVGLGAIKYFDLSHNRKSDIIFRWEDVLNFEGNTGPYLQYTHARLKSILRKFKKETVRVPKGISLDGLEHRLLIETSRLPEVIEDSIKDFMPNIMANYLYNLASISNEFYHSHPVIKEKNMDRRNFRCVLVSGIALALEKGLWCLGIDAPEEM